MPYAHTTFAILKQELADRLGDSGKVFWIDDELGEYLYEAIRVYGVLTGFFRERMVSFNTSANTAFYDLRSQFSAFLGYTVTDRSLVETIQYHLLEPSTGSSWTGTEMFVLDDVTQALQRRRNQYLAETGCRLVRRTAIALAAGGDGRIDLSAVSDAIIDLRRLIWFENGGNRYLLWREDEFGLTAFDSAWTTQARPYAWSALASVPQTIQIAPIPSTAATLETLTVESGAAFDPATSATAVGIPDDLCWVIKWGALADLLGQEGQAYDPLRAAYCEERYRMGVRLGRLLSIVVNARLGGTQTLPVALSDLEAARMDWENTTGTPDVVAFMGNWIAVSPVPTGATAILVDVVRNAVVPATDATQVQLGREQLDGIIDYAEHLASFKMGGEEFLATRRQADNFLLQSLLFNERLAANARYILGVAGVKDKYARPRRIMPGESVGTLRPVEMALTEGESRG